MKLYVYEHCPFCIRARLAANVKNIPIEIIILANDDEQSHFELVDKKIVPILEKSDGTYMIESLDICHYFDDLSIEPKIERASQNHTTMNLIDEVMSLSRVLTHPRAIFHPENVKDFPTDSAKQYFRVKKEKTINMTFEDAIAQSKILCAPLQAKLYELEDRLLYSYITGNNFSYDDLIAFPVLRALTVALDVLIIPEKMLQYLTLISNQTNIQLYPKYDFSKHS